MTVRPSHVRPIFGLLIVLALCNATLCLSIANGDESDASKTPLDLPIERTLSADEDLDVPETILFWGQEYQSDLFVLCIPATISPATDPCGHPIAGTSLNTLIADEVRSAIQQLSKESRFSLVAYNTGTYVWSWRVRRATQSAKANAIAWLDTLPLVDGACMLEAALSTVTISQSSGAERKRMIAVGVAKEPYCGGDPTDSSYAQLVADQMTLANQEFTPIDTVFFRTSIWDDEDFWVDLAASNGGTYHNSGF